MSIPKMTQFADKLRAQSNLEVDVENRLSVSSDFANKILSQIVSSLAMSIARHGTLFMKDKFHDKAYHRTTFTAKKTRCLTLFETVK